MRRLARAARRLVLTLGLLAAFGAMTPAVATVQLAPGEPFDRAMADALLGDDVAAAVGAEAARISVTAPQLPLANPYSEPAVLDVARLALTGRDGFRATVRVSVGANDPLLLELTGGFQRLVRLPVPTANIAEGTLLDRVTFTTLALPTPRVRGAWVRDEAALVGTEALRPLLEGKPIAVDAVGAPRLVRRGDRVTLVFTAGQLALKAIGTARQDGGLHSWVEVKNDRSGVIVQGRVTGPGEVAVETVR